jgi:hypothetical protein
MIKNIMNARRHSFAMAVFSKSFSGTPLASISYHEQANSLNDSFIKAFETFVLFERDLPHRRISAQLRSVRIRNCWWCMVQAVHRFQFCVWDAGQIIIICCRCTGGSVVRARY